MKALVTGANGLIGAHLVRELCQQQVAVRAMVRTTSQLDALHGVDAERVTGDVLHGVDTLAPLMMGCDYVFHTAAHFAYAGFSSEELIHTAVEGTRQVLLAAAKAKVRRVILTSSSVIFGSSDSPLQCDETAPMGSVNSDGFAESAYVDSKVRQDRLAVELANTLGIELVVACPTMSLGPQATTLGPSNSIILAYLADPLRMSYPGGCNLVATRDVAIGHWLAARHGQSGEHYLLGSENLSWPQIHSLISELCGVDTPRIQINRTLAFCAAMLEEARSSLSSRAPLTTRHQARMVGRYYWYSHAKAASLGYTPTPAREALAEACAWLAASPHVSRALRATMRLAPEVHAARAALQTRALA